MSYMNYGEYLSGECSDWDFFLSNQLNLPFITYNFTKLVLNYGAFDPFYNQEYYSSFTCSDSNIVQELVTSIYSKKSITVSCNKSNLSISYCPGLGLSLCSKCIDPCRPECDLIKKRTILINPCIECSTSNSFYHTASFEYNIINEDYPKLTSLLATSITKNSIEITVASDNYGYLYCTYQNPLQNYYNLLNSDSYHWIESGFSISMNQAGSYLVKFNNLTPNTNYAIYCFTKSFNLFPMPISEVIQNRKVIKTNCCQGIISSTLPNKYVSSMMFTITPLIFNIITETSLLENFKLSSSITPCSVNSFDIFPNLSPSQLIVPSSNVSIATSSYSLIVSPGCYVVKIDYLTLNNNLLDSFSSTINISTDPTVIDPPVLKSALLNNFGTEINLVFNVETDKGSISGINNSSFSCSRIINNSLFDSFNCNWIDSKTLTIKIISLSSNIINSQISIKSNTLRSKICIDYSEYSTVSLCQTSLSTILVPIDFPNINLYPIPSLFAQSEISLCQDLILDPLLSSNNFNSPWVSVKWNIKYIDNEFTDSLAYEQSIQLYLDNLTSTTLNIIKIPSLSVKKGKYIFTISLTNIFGYSASSSQSVMGIDSFPIYVKIASPRNLQIFSDKLYSFLSSSYFSPCISNILSSFPSLPYHFYTWIIYDENFNPVQKVASDYNSNFVINPHSLEVNRNYKLVLTVTSKLTEPFYSNLTSSQIEILNTIKGTDVIEFFYIDSSYSKIPTYTNGLISFIKGGENQILPPSIIILDGSYSTFNRKIDTNLSYSWECIDQSARTYGFACTSFENSYSNKQKYDLTKYSPGSILKFTLTVSIYGYVSQSSVNVQVSESSTPIIQLIPYRVFYNFDHFFKLEAKISDSINYYTNWTVLPNAILYNENSEKIITSPSYLYQTFIPKEFDTTSYTLTLSLSSNDKVYQSSITFPINYPPQNGDFIIDPLFGVELVTQFDLFPYGWSDQPEDYPLYYKWTSISTNNFENALSLYYFNNKDTLILPRGDSKNSDKLTLKLYVSDYFGAYTSINKSVVVTSNINSIEEFSEYFLDSKRLSNLKNSLNTLTSVTSYISQIINECNIATESFCSDLNRSPCSYLNECGSCLHGYYSTGSVNSKCRPIPNKSRRLSSSQCQDDFDCIDGNCIDGICTKTLLSCVDNCNNHGSCIILSTSHNSQCYSDDITCSATCKCNNFYGRTCQFTLEEYNELIKSYTLTCEIFIELSNAFHSNVEIYESSFYINFLKNIIKNLEKLYILDLSISSLDCLFDFDSFINNIPDLFFSQVENIEYFLKFISIYQKVDPNFHLTSIQNTLYKIGLSFKSLSTNSNNFNSNIVKSYIYNNQTDFIYENFNLRLSSFILRSAIDNHIELSLPLTEIEQQNESESNLIFSFDSNSLGLSLDEYIVSTFLHESITLENNNTMYNPTSLTSYLIIMASDDHNYNPFSTLITTSSLTNTFSEIQLNQFNYKIKHQNFIDFNIENISNGTFKCLRNIEPYHITIDCPYGPIEFNCSGLIGGEFFYTCPYYTRRPHCILNYNGVYHLDDENPICRVVKFNGEFTECSCNLELLNNENTRRLDLNNGISFFSTFSDTLSSPKFVNSNNIITEINNGYSSFSLVYYSLIILLFLFILIFLFFSLFYKNKSIYLFNKKINNHSKKIHPSINSNAHLNFISNDSKTLVSSTTNVSQFIVRNNFFPLLNDDIDFKLSQISSTLSSYIPISIFSYKRSSAFLDSIVRNGRISLKGHVDNIIKYDSDDEEVLNSNLSLFNKDMNQDASNISHNEEFVDIKNKKNLIESVDKSSIFKLFSNLIDAKYFQPRDIDIEWFLNSIIPFELTLFSNLNIISTHLLTQHDLFGFFLSFYINFFSNSVQPFTSHILSHAEQLEITPKDRDLGDSISSVFSTFSPRKFLLHFFSKLFLLFAFNSVIISYIWKPELYDQPNLNETDPLNSCSKFTNQEDCESYLIKPFGSIYSFGNYCKWSLDIKQMPCQYNSELLEIKHFFSSEGSKLIFLISTIVSFNIILLMLYEKFIRVFFNLYNLNLINKIKQDQNESYINQKTRINKLKTSKNITKIVPFQVGPEAPKFDYENDKGEIKIDDIEDEKIESKIIIKDKNSLLDNYIKISSHRLHLMINHKNLLKLGVKLVKLHNTTDKLTINQEFYLIYYHYLMKQKERSINEGKNSIIEFINVSDGSSSSYEEINYFTSTRHNKNFIFILFSNISIFFINLLFKFTDFIYISDNIFITIYYYFIYIKFYFLSKDLYNHYIDEFPPENFSTSSSTFFSTAIQRKILYQIKMQRRNVKRLYQDFISYNNNSNTQTSPNKSSLLTEIDLDSIIFQKFLLSLLPSLFLKKIASLIFFNKLCYLKNNLISKKLYYVFIFLKVFIYISFFVVIFFFNKSFNFQFFKIWWVLIGLSILIYYILIVPYLIFNNSILMPSLYKSLIQKNFIFFKEKISTLNQYNNQVKKFQHHFNFNQQFNTIIRISKFFPFLATSRLLILLNDSDFERNFKHLTTFHHLVNELKLIKKIWKYYFSKDKKISQFNNYNLNNHHESNLDSPIQSPIPQDFQYIKLTSTINIPLKKFSFNYFILSLLLIIFIKIPSHIFISIFYSIYSLYLSIIIYPLLIIFPSFFHQFIVDSTNLISLLVGLNILIFYSIISNNSIYYFIVLGICILSLFAIIISLFSLYFYFHIINKNILSKLIEKFKFKNKNNSKQSISKNKVYLDSISSFTDIEFVEKTDKSSVPNSQSDLNNLDNTLNNQIEAFEQVLDEQNLLYKNIRESVMDFSINEVISYRQEKDQVYKLYDELYYKHLQFQKEQENLKLQQMHEEEARKLEFQQKEILSQVIVKDNENIDIDEIKNNLISPTNKHDEAFLSINLPVNKTIPSSFTSFNYKDFLFLNSKLRKIFMPNGKLLEFGRFKVPRSKTKDQTNFGQSPPVSARRISFPSPRIPKDSPRTPRDSISPRVISNIPRIVSQMKKFEDIKQNKNKFQYKDPLNKENNVKINDEMFSSNIHPHISSSSKNSSQSSLFSSHVAESDSEIVFSAPTPPFTSITMANNEKLMNNVFIHKGLGNETLLPPIIQANSNQQIQSSLTISIDPSPLISPLNSSYSNSSGFQNKFYHTYSNSSITSNASTINNNINNKGVILPPLISPPSAISPSIFKRKFSNLNNLNK